MNVGELKRKLAEVADDVLVVRGGSDHSYYRAEAAPADAELMPDGEMAEYWDDANMSYSKSKKIKVFVVD